ncbi:MAG: outer membrane lipoprotein chaperone LolA [Legionella sp.]|nr:outer membrane lipoprotein chaperone LolA [Legionella sp.]
MKKCLMLALVAVSHIVFGQTPAPVQVLQNKLNVLHTMSALFEQEVKVQNRALSYSSGNMALQRPGLFRWEIKSPMEQLIVADGHKMWVYDKDLEQVTVKKQTKELGGTAALFLSGDNETLGHDFDVSQKEQEGMMIFDLRAKSTQANFQTIQLIFKQNTLTSLRLLDQLGQITIVTLSNMQINPKLSSTLFQFTPPKGVDVVHQ